MSEHLEKLKKCRETAVKARRIAVDGVNLENGANLENVQRRQEQIDAIDRAIADEEKLLPPKPLPDWKGISEELGKTALRK